MKRIRGFISAIFMMQGMRKVFSSLIFVASLAVFLSLSGTASGTTLYVGLGEMYTEIQPAIDAAYDGDTIIVRDGTYTGAGNKNLDFGGKSITLKSENGPQYCIIDCEQSGRGFYIKGGGPVVDGFTIKNGNVTGFPGGEPYNYGGGILCWGASPTIKNCSIINNRSSRGGGITCYHASPLITHCTISGNQSDVHGGAIFVYQGSPPIINCMITENSAGDYQLGGAIYLQYSYSQIINCTISKNRIDVRGCGGAIWCDDTAWPNISNCIFFDNLAMYGPEIECRWSSPTIQYSNIDPAKIRGTINWGDWKPWPGNGNINYDPLFFGGGDYHLTELSPCVDVGTDAGVYTDIDGDARPYDVPNWNKDDTGDEFDMGADEFALPCLYDFYGFIEPLPFEDSGEVRIFKSNRVIPVKFILYDSFGMEITSLSEPPIISILYAGSGDPGGNPEEYDVTGQADDGNTFRYSDENWIFNLSMRSFSIDSSYDIIVTIPETECSHQVRIYLVK
jgi:hypothetical protein